MERGLSYVAFSVLVLAALILVPLSAALMPPQVASSFAADGSATVMMSRGSYLALIASLTVALPLVMVTTVGWLARHAPTTLSLPNKAYWFAPERLADAVAWLRVHLARLGSLLTIFIGAMHGLVVSANLRHPPRLDTTGMVALVVPFLILMLLWVRALYGRFGAPPR